MKRILLNVLSLVVFICAGSLFLTSCTDDTDCKVIVVAKDANDTNVVVRNATVFIGKETASINQTGLTDEKGEFSCTFQNPAFLDVTAELTQLYKGASSVRLRPGETVRVLVLLREVN